MASKAKNHGGVLLSFSTKEQQKAVVTATCIAAGFQVSSEPGDTYTIITRNGDRIPGLSAQTACLMAAGVLTGPLIDQIQAFQAQPGDQELNPARGQLIDRLRAHRDAEEAHLVE